jgi:hypothetical protein
MGEVHVDAISPLFVRCNDQTRRPEIGLEINSLHEVRTETAKVPTPASDNP